MIWWIAGISATLSALAIIYAARQVTPARRRWFVIAVTLLIASISMLLFPRLAGELFR